MMSSKMIQRVVTGHNAQGEAVVLFQGAAPNVKAIAQAPGTVFYEIWNTTDRNISATTEDVSLAPLNLAPPKGGSRIRFVDIPPDQEYLAQVSSEGISQAFAEIGSQQASTASGHSPHPLMHRTETIDYGIVIQGRISLILDTEEVVVEQGGVVIQRGTNHAWANRSDQVCRLAFILLDAEFEPELKQTLQDQH
jgi:mannose-6-phosphate isomerase-like protein (cupin superfamily)